MREIIIVTPVYNDWKSLEILLESLDRISASQNLLFRILAVDDGSTQYATPLFHPRTQVLRIARNLGHQRAIAIGLAFTNDMGVDVPVVVLDCDGEDRPEDIPALLSVYDRFPTHVIFAQRIKRSEGFLFSVFYICFKIIFRCLTGRGISFGNFCIIPPTQIRRIVYLQEIWNHFAAGIMKSGIAWKVVPTTRGRRYAGTSHMNLVGLVLHGLSAISVYIEVVYVRLIFVVLILMGIDAFSFIVLLYIRFLTPLAIPGWATNVAIGLTVVMVQALLFLVLLSFFVLSYRSAKMFIPALNYKDFIIDSEE